MRFEAVQLKAHESEITLKYSESRIDVHLGFLQINRHYIVTFVIQDDLGEDLIFDPLQNLHARIINYEPTEDGMPSTVMNLAMSQKNLLFAYVKTKVQIS